MVLSFGRLKEVAFQFASRNVAAVGVHWVGRSVLCAGEGCPACDLRLPRQMFYGGLIYKSQRKVAELPSCVAEVASQACHEFGRTDLLGVCLHMVRSSCRDVWRLEAAKWLPLAFEVVSDYDVARELATMLRVSSPTKLEGFSGWLERVRPGQRRVLSQCQLF